ncbi:hypothetical protein H6G54_24725 [Anabaena cylindrica FACHB-243]|uniref:Uncharacterized protein n=1 Tax=Anabaena cylindrica (strain ATCC 27899 / PCC 7122) TaxID=272123 RepID=K9ZCT6_ANACC|nr:MULTISPECIES: hypothetical protein [Anabaena]AFZ56534.1 hypothetical protein Anacy_0959 [Anabaena cylindrica PCC 7122]MBD2420848.1 hypothetical protein [Anabaena cylindrica FACHB-243]MBY5285489.1 hypothetical protein [Anabaena sp. CCAP 1446/1C]MBY5311144.1 hypothetical protein [Anabaena sp. CCAP 1446/1C]MCM2409785.1 hypothetical protein [Anabaena sp. CCAP 1446/1C]
MSPVTQNPSPTSGFNPTFLNIPQSCLLQIGITSILLLLIADKATGKALEALGEASEEVFRGDRLPILDFPHEQELNQS